MSLAAQVFLLFCAGASLAYVIVDGIRHGDWW
jgi:hypothetical protein